LLTHSLTSIFSHFSVSFYGNKLFQSTFILSLTGEETTLLDFSLAATLNAAVALAGYLGAAWLVDRVGRRRLQQWGFLLTGVLFVGCGFLYQNLSSSALVAMYLGSSFFGQLGPNATTFLLPAEVFPTEVRTVCHGVAAASGKLGALLAAVLFNYVSELDMFLLSGYASLMACAVTMWTIPETLGLDLFEIDRKWRMTLDGRKGEYQGDAIHPKYLSYYEQKKVCLQQRHDRPDDHFEAME
jgi:MFS family permease